MYIRIGFDLVYDLPAPTPMLLMLHTHPQHRSSLLKPDRLVFAPVVGEERYVDGFGNLASRILAPAGEVRFTYDNVIVDSGRYEPTIEGAALHAVDDVESEPCREASRIEWDSVYD